LTLKAVITTAHRGKKGDNMKALIGALAAIPVIGVLLIICLAIFSLICTFYGLYLAFSASILLGILVLIIEPSPFVIGFVMFCFDKNLAQMLLDFLTK
jgi:hypothetical protein